MLKQVSVFAENSKGRLKEITTLLMENNINILGSVTNDSAEYGIIRMVVSDPDKCVETLKNNGYVCKTTSVLGIEIPDEVGALNKVLCVLDDCNINLDYLYLSFNRESAAPIMVFHTDDPAEVQEILKLKGFTAI